MGHLVIDEQRYESLKQRARALGISEDELVRRAIDAVLVEPPVESTAPHRAIKIAAFLATARALAEGHEEGGLYRFSRDELYEAREARWTRTE